MGQPQWIIVPIQHGVPLVWHPLELCHKCSSLPAIVMLQQLWASFRSAVELETSSAVQQNINFQGIPQSDCFHFYQLNELSTIVPVKKHLYPWFIVCNFEAILNPVAEQQRTSHLQWLQKHEPILISVASSVGGFEAVKCFVNSYPKCFIKETMSYIGSIAYTTRDSAEAK